MTVRVRFLLGLTVGLMLPGGTVFAQYGYPVGRYEFGGWSSTPQGDIARGMGNLAAGAGRYNAQTAVANSINADTIMRYNQYMYTAQQEQNRKYYERQARKLGKVNATAAETADRLRNRPEPGDIDRGDALNVLLDDLTAPALLNTSALRLAGGAIDAATVREVPFRNAADAVTIRIDQLADKEKFPALLRSEPLTAEREAFIKAAREAARQAREQGEISGEAVRAVQTTGRALYEKAKSPDIRATPDKRDEALNYLKGMAAMARILENADTLQAFKELKKIKTTKIGNLVAFMQTYNLRFGPAVTPTQRDAYRKLYPLLKADRDLIYDAHPMPSEPPPPPDPKANPAELFQGLDEKQVLAPQKP
jgi:hypothetical protein